jgi:hypothetical protein
LTPLGSHRLGAILFERWDESVAWTLATRDKLGDPIRRDPPIKPKDSRWGKDDENFLSLLEDPNPSPLEAVIESEQFLMREKRTKDERPELDPETGRVVMEPVFLFGGIPILVDRKIRGKAVKVRLGRKAKMK